MEVASPPAEQKTGKPLSPSAEKLFQPISLGPYDLRHRIVMAPLTRSRAGPGNVPTPLMAAYYAQRASAALIISEATQVSMQGQGYAWTPGIHTREQVDGWRMVTAAVHASGGLIFLQLWHVGRISHPALQPDNMLPVAPSAIKADAMAFIENGEGQGENVPCIKPRALDNEEMPYIVRQYERGAKNAIRAGFDGIEVHGANGYLIDQFIETKSNRRSDNYGGSVENRSRLLMQVIEVVSGIFGPERVGVRLSPMGTFNDMGDEHPELTFGHIAEKLNDFKLAYLHVINPAAAALEKRVPPPPQAMKMVDIMRNKYRGLLMLAGGFDHDTAEEWLEQGKADLIAFGRKFLANPDLPERFRERAPLNPDDPSTYYGGGAKGYTDYPTLKQLRGQAPKPVVDESWR
jgi:N-ethylmaleimide reductase